MNMFDEARAMSGTLALCKISQTELAERLGVSQSYVANKLRLLAFSEVMQARIIEAGISERHARALLRLESEEGQAAMLEKIIERGMTVRECEAAIDVEVTLSPQRFIGKGERTSCIERFHSSIKSGVESLVALGVDARSRTQIQGNKMYITICINEI